MTFFGYDLDFHPSLEEQYARYVISPLLLELFAETNAESIPYELVKMPHELMFIEVKDQITPNVVICGMIAKYFEEEDKVQSTNSYRIQPIYNIGGRCYNPITFVISSLGDTIDNARVDWYTATEKASDIGLYEEHPLVKRASYYCWMVFVMTCIYSTCNDADIILGINTKEYKKITKKKKPKQSKLKQLRNTRYLGRNIKIDRKILDSKRPNKGGTHASPIPHWRSGHFRHLGTGKIIWIRPCIIGFGKTKKIPKLREHLLK